MWSSMKNPSVAVVVTHTALEQSQGKWLGLAPYLKHYGFRPTILTWNKKVLPALQDQNIPFIYVTLERKDFNRVIEAEKLRALLDRPITNMDNAPTWGDLLVMDDWLGMAEWYDIAGMEPIRPDVVVVDYGGPEASTPEDEQMRLALWRFAASNKIPVLALESQTLDQRLKISRWPADLLMVKYEETSDDLPQVRLSPASRHFVNFPHDPVIESFLLNEKSLRTQLGMQEETRLLLVPFHLYYTWECFQVLAKLGEQAEELRNKHVMVLVSCGPAFRRNLKEKDIILEGGKRWVEKIPSLQVVEGGSTLHWLLLSDACFIPYPSSNLKEACIRWSIPWFGLEDTKRWSNVPTTTTPAQALAFLTERDK